MAGPLTFTRRKLLTAVGAALGGATFAQGTGLVAPGNKAQDVLFGVRTPFGEKTLRERALLLQQLGYDGIELGPELMDQSVNRIKEGLKGTDIVISAVAGSTQLLDTNPQVRTQAIELDRRRLEMAKALGASGVIEVAVVGPIMRPREVEDRLLVAALKQLAPDVKRTGVNLLIEPRTKKESPYMNLQREGAEIIKAVGEQGFKLLSDFYHMQTEERDIEKTLRAYGEYTAYVHLADGEKRTEPGSLPFDYRPGFRALKKWGFSGWLTVESEASDNPHAALGRALKYVKQQWREA